MGSDPIRWRGETPRSECPRQESKPATRGLVTMERPARSASTRGSSTTMSGRSHIRKGAGRAQCLAHQGSHPPRARRPQGLDLGGDPSSGQRGGRRGADLPRRDLRAPARRSARRAEGRACYEAGPTGYELHRLLTSLGVRCQVIAPSLIPKAPGDRIKTDRRDARRLARLHRAGELTAIRVPSPQEEAVRDLCRARDDAVADRTRARHRLSKFLLRHGHVWRAGNQWTLTHDR